MWSINWARQQWSQENKTVAHGSMTAIKEWGGSLTFDVDKVDRSHSHVIVELIESVQPSNGKTLCVLTLYIGQVRRRARVCSHV